MTATTTTTKRESLSSRRTSSQSQPRRRLRRRGREAILLSEQGFFSQPSGRLRDLKAAFGMQLWPPRDPSVLLSDLSETEDEFDRVDEDRKVVCVELSQRAFYSLCKGSSSPFKHFWHAILHTALSLTSRSSLQYLFPR